MKLFAKAFFLVLLVALLTVCCVACGDTTGDDDPNATTTAPTTTAAPTYSLALSADKTVAERGDAVTLSAVLQAANVDDAPATDAVYSIVEGESYATISGNTLTVLATAPHGAVIRVQAREGATLSNTVTVTVSVPVEELTIAPIGAANVSAGATVVFRSVIVPTGAPSDVVYEIVEGSEYGALIDSVLIVNGNAPTGATIKVKAKAGTVESNVIDIVVGVPPEQFELF